VRSLLSVALMSMFISIVSGCVVRETRPGPRGCPGGVWVEGYRGPRGRFHPGHWRCPGVVERIEIE
jgi:hypothetical protein